MQKFIGAVFIIVAGAGIGVAKAQEMKKRLSDMQEIKRIFLLLKSQIQYTRAPFTSVFLSIARRCEGTYKEWLLCLSKELEKGQGSRVQELWNASIERFCSKTQLQQTDLDLLQTLGTNMGHLDIETQVGSIQFFLEQWDELIERTSADLGAKRRLCHCLGIMGGIFLVILLV